MVAKDSKHYRILLMLLYNGVRISGFLDLKGRNVHLDEQSLMELVVKPRIEFEKFLSQIRFYLSTKLWFENNQISEYLIHTPDCKHFQYLNYYDSYFHSLMEQLKIDRTPHCCRHTCISMLAKAGINQPIIKKIVEHSDAITLTEKVYTHFDIKKLVIATL